MRKIIIPLAGMLASMALAPEASAIPAFARQTGLACNSCHFQHFPVLAPTGQEFRAGAYTQISGKGKFKSEGLSIPDTLNAAILIKARYQNSSGKDAPGTPAGGSTNSGEIQFPDELSLFFGGRIGDNGTVKVGFMNENALLGGPNGGIITGLKIPFVMPFDPFSVMVVPYATDALGMAYGFEQSSTGMTRGIRWAEHRTETSAAQYTGIGSGQASGLAFVVNHELGYINVSKWAPSLFFGGNSGTTGGNRPSSTWVRVAATPNLYGWSMHIGAGIARGQSSDDTAATVKTRGEVLDFQGQGEIAGLQTSVYAQYANAPSRGTVIPNQFNTGLMGRHATTVGVDVTVIPHTLSLGAAYRAATTGKAAGEKDNAVTLAAVYDVMQNIALHADYSRYSGSAYNVGGSKDTGVPGNTGRSLLTLMLEAAW